MQRPESYVDAAVRASRTVAYLVGVQHELREEVRAAWRALAVRARFAIIETYSSGRQVGFLHKNRRIHGRT